MVRIGQITRAHGIRGELRVRLYGLDSASLARLESVFLRSPDGQERCWSVCSARTGPRGSVLLRLEGVEDRDLAKTLVRFELYAERDALPPLESDEFYYDDLVGLTVIGEAGEVLGTVTHLFNAGASDVAVVQGATGEWMFPVVDEVVREIDEAGQRLLVSLLPGLLDGGK